VTSPLPPSRRPWLTARREERLVTLFRVGLVVLVVGLGILGWRTVRALLDAPQDQLVATCAGGPYSHGVILAAGGPGEVDQQDDVLLPYTRTPALTSRWLGHLHDAALRAGDRDLATTALSASRARPDALPLEQLARIERSCTEAMAQAGVDPAPREWFRPGP
jgi:hypothetical protein